MTVLMDAPVTRLTDRRDTPSTSRLMMVARLVTDSLFIFKLIQDVSIGVKKKRLPKQPLMAIPRRIGGQSAFFTVARLASSSPMSK